MPRITCGSDGEREGPTDLDGDDIGVVDVNRRRKAGSGGFAGVPRCAWCSCKVSMTGSTAYQRVYLVIAVFNK